MNRIEAVRKLLSENEAALIFAPVSRLYLSGFQSSLGYLFITKSDAALFVDGRYIEAAKKTVNQEINVQLFTNISEQAKGFLGDKIDTLVVETIIAVANVTTFEKQFGKKVVPLTELDKEICSLRSIKTEYEIECMTKAHQFDALVMIPNCDKIVPGMLMAAARLDLPTVFCKRRSYDAWQLTWKR